MGYSYKYPRPAVTTDCIVFGYDSSSIPSVLLVERGNEPFKGKWAFPGGFLDMNETAEECAGRELFEETGLKDVPLRQVYTASKIDRDPRGRTISIVFMAKVEISESRIVAGDDARKAKWFKINDMPPLAFDHDEILKKAVEKL